MYEMQLKQCLREIHSSGEKKKIQINHVSSLRNKKKEKQNPKQIERNNKDESSNREK